MLINNIFVNISLRVLIKYTPMLIVREEIEDVLNPEPDLRHFPVIEGEFYSKSSHSPFQFLVLK